MSVIENRIVPRIEPLISVIIPVYNVAPYLRQCISSLLEQSMNEIEIIIIDDGSTDRSAAICDCYSLVSSKLVKVIHQKNQGLSIARNIGLEIAQADNIMFVDGDDWVERDFCRIPYEIAIENKVRLVFFPFFRHDHNGTIYKSQTFPQGMKTREATMRMVHDGNGFLAVWNKLYKKELFDDIRFPSGRYFEDQVTTLQLIQKAERIYYVDSPLYNYRFRNGSIITLKDRKSADDWVAMRRERIRLLKSWKYDLEAEKLLPEYCWNYLIWNGNKGKESKRCRNYILKKGNAPKEISWRSKLMIYLLRFSPALFDTVCALTGMRL